MFFPRLRRRAKWVFLLIALAFGLSFVVAGVGSGFGSGIGDYLADIFNRQPGAGPSVEDARERVEKNPRDPGAQLALANALQANAETDEATTAYERYVELRPNDQEALQSLASLYLSKAGEAEQGARAAQVEGARAFFANELQDPESKLGKELGVDPITTYRQEQASQAYQTAFMEAQQAYVKEAEIWTRLTKLDSEEPEYFYELGRSSQQAGDTAAAITAYERFLELAPDDTRARDVRQFLPQLRQQQKQQEQQQALPGGG
jgi:tetratricopeptide (TPR) repeat protein